MEVKPVINPKDFEVGGLIVRMQVDELHDGHVNLINHVLANHDKVILFLGVPVIENTKRNPLDFITRERMIKEMFPRLTIQPIKDERNNEIWSKKLDASIALVGGQRSTVLYGSRDSFIPYYKGKHKTIELEATIEISGTEVREAIARKPRNSADFRAGVIYGIHSKRDVTYGAVDVVAFNEKGQILLGKKPDEKLWRFLGGFVDRGDKSNEFAATREFREETGGSCNVGKMKYILSQQVDDWRYRSEPDGIMTQLFLTQYQSGFVQGSDDIAELKWIDANTFSNFDGIRTNIMIEHRQMMTDFINIVYEENLIPNIGDRLPEREGNITYTIE